MQFGLFMMPLHPPERSFTESALWVGRRLGYHVWIGGLTEGKTLRRPSCLAQALLKRYLACLDGGSGATGG